MKNHGFRGSILAMSALFAGLLSVSGRASTLVIPSSAAQRTDDYSQSDCYWDTFLVKASTAQPESCQIMFPINLPAGTTIQQIAVVHGSDGPAPGLGATLFSIGNASWLDQTAMFSKSSYISIPSLTLLTMPLMAQIKNVYPDAFVMLGNRSYAVRVGMTDGAYVTAIQITYQ
jgi:hypothetical protein